MFDNFEVISAELPWFMPALIFIFGAVVGSFLNVCIYRIPSNQSVVKPPSTCACGVRIPWYHNIPILSWFILRGKAACCGQAFSPRYALLELLTGVLFVACWLRFAPSVALVGMLFVCLMMVGTFVDLDHMIIPDRVSIGGMILGVGLSFCIPDLHGMGAATLEGYLKSGVIGIMGAIVGAGLVYWIAILGELILGKPAMGEGDVKFLGCIGAFCGWEGALFGMFGGAVLGCLILLPLILLGRIFGWQQAVPDEANATEEQVAFGTQVPFGPMLALAGLIYFFGFSAYVDAYLKNVMTVLGGF